MEMNEIEMKKWQQLKRDIEALPRTTKEKKRIDAEFKLFEERGWEKYILFLCEVMKALKKKGVAGAENGGSACDSYVLGKLSMERDKELKDLFSNERACQILFNDALRMNWNILWPHDEYTEKSIRELDALLDPLVKKSGLHVAQNIQKVYPQRRGDNGRITVVEHIVLSTASIPDEDMYLILHEKRESSPEEAARLRKYLIIKVTVEWNRESGFAL